jgi:hypothetical protein
MGCLHEPAVIYPALDRSWRILWLVTDPEKAESLSRFRIYTALECNLLQNPRLIRKHGRAYVKAMDQASSLCRRPFRLAYFLTLRRSAPPPLSVTSKC